MAIKKFENKALKISEETKIKTKEEEYFFSNIDGRQITVKATSAEEAERKARSLINKL
jgi:hypothetical protein